MSDVKHRYFVCTCNIISIIITYAQSHDIAYVHVYMISQWIPQLNTTIHMTTQP